MKQALQTIDFYGSRIYTVDKDGEHYVAMKPICENIGLQWRAQRKRILRHPVLSEGVSMMDTTCSGIDGKEYVTEMLMLPIKLLHGWLFGVDLNRVKPEIKDRLLQYQRECFDVLNQYWQNKSHSDHLDTSSTAACFSDLHVFIELTRGRMRISKYGNRYNYVSISVALVLQYLYNKSDKEREMQVSARKMGVELQIDRKTVSRALIKMSSWAFLIKKTEPGLNTSVRLNLKIIDEALQSSKNSLLANQQQTGYLVN